MDQTNHEYVYRIASFALIPYLIMTLFTIPYFIHQKILISRRIKNIPASTIFATDLSKVKKNLQIQSLAHSFFLIISSFEATMCFMSCIVSIYHAFRSNTWESISNTSITIVNININKSCILYGETTFFGIFIDINGSLGYLIPILLNLFMIVLRRAYLNAQYKRWIIGYSGYFLLRFSYLVLSNYFIITQYVMHIMELPFFTLDVYVFVYVSKKFYLLLKGLSEEAKWHFTRQEYIQKQKWTKIFAILRRFLLFAASFFMIMVLLNSTNEIATVIRHSDCLIQYLFPNTAITFTVSKNLIDISNKISLGCNFVRNICTGIVGVSLSLANLAILTSIIVKLIRRRKKYIHVNDWITRPLMEKYRADVQRQHQRRPPFIQAFRSQLMY